MKKLILGLTAILLLTAVHAQDGKKAYRDAKKAFSTYNLDPTGNKAQLSEAATQIDVALQDAEIAQDPTAWALKGEIFNEVANQIVAVRQLGIGSLDELPKVDHPAHKAAEAYMKSYELAEKKWQTKDALKGFQQAQGHLSNMGIFFYEDQDYDSALENFQMVIELHDKLKADGEASSLDSEDGTNEGYNNQLYITGLAALNAGKPEAASGYFRKLYDMKYEKPAIYEALYKIEADKDRAAAYKYLEEGRKLFPDDVSILFAEINHFLAINELDKLIDKLEQGIAKEPDNVSLYSTLGNVYDNLHQKEMEAGNTEKAQEYFDKALAQYQKAIEKDPSYSDALYSIGALYYNKAAAMTQELNKYADDYSKEGLKKYEELKKKIFEEFDKALPYFQKAEARNPSDMNTLIALKEIYARKDNLEMSNEFKERLDKVQAGETIGTPYFKQ
ncbi:MAG: tetratricopeptide repeat protein [Phaeodactylibacter sp.]|nr:tetratricopeptide repeat protein [Phaeodactylibacter sp.]